MCIHEQLGSASLEYQGKGRRLANETKEVPPQPFPQPLYGYLAQWVSEVADQALNDGLLRHADTFPDPSWGRDGLFYPRNDNQSDGDGIWKLMEPYTGNGAIVYARLNVPDGQKKMLEKLWSKEHFSSFPFVDEIDLASDVDFLKGNWDSRKEAFVVTMRTWNGFTKTVRFFLKNLPVGRYGIYRNEDVFKVQDVNVNAETVEAIVEVGAGDTDIVLLKSV